jgi:hypothetical protein
MRTIRVAALTALLALLLAGFGMGGASGVVAAGHHTPHVRQTRTHPTSAHVERRAHHHGSGMTAHQHHERHERHVRHARTHGQHKH